MPGKLGRAMLANGLLGYPDDARLLILNADDLGMSASVNEGVLRAARDGVVSSTSLMAPWPSAAQAMQMLREHPEITFGVHLTVICDMPGYRWGPMAPADQVPSLLEADGCFVDMKSLPAFVERAKLDELEVEFRAQIDAVLAAGLRPTHLDWHCLDDGGRPDVFALTVRLAREHGLAVRVSDGRLTGELRGQGLPADDHRLLNSYDYDPASKAARYARLLRELPAGLTEWAVHPAIDGQELRTLEPETWRVRHTDYEFLASAEARETIEREGIVLLGYEPLRQVWARH
jgi:hypothetical protein